MSAKRQPITDDQLQGFKYFRKFLPVLDRLHDTATARDRAANRVLHFDQYIALQLIFFFNPIVSSMRGLVQASHLKNVQEQLGVSPTSLGSFSEAGSVFDAHLLKPIIAELGMQLRPLPHDARLDDLPGRLTAVDGTELSALAKLAGRAIEGRDIKLHTHYEPLTGVPVDIDLTAAGDSEVENLMKRLLPDRVYAKDRGYACFRLFQGIVRARTGTATIRLNPHLRRQLRSASLTIGIHPSFCTPAPSRTPSPVASPPPRQRPALTATAGRLGLGEAQCGQMHGAPIAPRDACPLPPCQTRHAVPSAEWFHRPRWVRPKEPSHTNPAHPPLQHHATQCNK